jgi:hypothetical protein
MPSAPAPRFHQPIISAVSSAPRKKGPITHRQKAGHSARPKPAFRAQAPAPFSQSALAFIPNRGQVAGPAAFYAQAGSHTIWFRTVDVILALPDATLRQVFVGAAPAARPQGQGQLPGVVNYFVGNDRARWHTGLPTYNQVLYRDLWPGVDLTYQGRSGALKSTFTIAPGADLTQIRLAYPSASSLRVDTQGNLVIRIGGAEIRDSAPLAWQPGSGLHGPIAVRYRLLDGGRSYGFTLGGGYDPTLPLIIDPDLDYGTYLGGTSVDGGRAITVQDSGIAFVAGSTISADFPAGARPGYDPSHNGANDAFVAMLGTDGTLACTTYLGGSDHDYGNDLVVDGEGNLYVTGYTYSTDFPTTTLSYQGTLAGDHDAFVVKLSSGGRLLSYSTYLGGSGGDVGHGIAIDDAGRAYVTGSTSAGFPTPAQGYDLSHNGGGDAFVVALNAGGTGLEYNTFLGHSQSETGWDIAVDHAGHAYVSGDTASPSFPTVPSCDAPPCHKGGIDAFVAKLDTSSTELTYAKLLGGSADDLGYGLAVDSTGHAYCTGVTHSSDFPYSDPTYDDQLWGTADAFVAKLSTDGTESAYATFLGGSGAEYGRAMAVDSLGNAYVYGYTNSTNFPTPEGGFDGSYNDGDWDAYLAILNPEGTDLLYGTYLGGSNEDQGWGLAVSGIGNVYMTGHVFSDNFPTTVGAHDRIYNGARDAFVSHFLLLPFMLDQGDRALETVQGYRVNFHQQAGDPSYTISDTLESYVNGGLLYFDRAQAYYEAALDWTEPGSYDETRALEGLLDTNWELASGAMLRGNDWLVKALDVKFEDPTDPLGEEIDQLGEAIDWYTLATEGYAKMLASQRYTDVIELQLTRVDPISDEPEEYLDLKRFTLAAARKSRAYLELAERQFRKYTASSKADAEATLRQGSAKALSDLALLEEAWTDAVDDTSYQALLRNLSDMQRLFRYLQEDKNPFGYGAEYVPFVFRTSQLPLNNYEQAMVQAEDKWTSASGATAEALAHQREADDDWQKLQKQLADVTDKYNDQLIRLCGADPEDTSAPDFEGCHENEAGEIYLQILRIEEANLRIQLVEEQMANQLALIRIEEERAARVAGIHRATAVMYTETGEKLADLADEEARLRNRRSWTDRITDFVTSVGEGAAAGAPYPPYGVYAGAIIGGLTSIGEMYEEEAKTQRMGTRAGKSERLKAQQSAYVEYAQAEIEDANSEALIKQYMLRFTEYDIELSIAVNNLQQELARLNGLKTQVEYLAAEKEKALAFTENLYRDPAQRVLRDYYTELANDSFDVALRYAWEAGRALAYEINQDVAFTGLPMSDLDDLYRVRDVTTLQAALNQMDTAYEDFYKRPDVPNEPQAMEDVILVSQALGLEDAYDADQGRIVTGQEKLAKLIQDPANRDDQGNLQLTFQTSIALGNPFFSTAVANDKITSVQMRLRGHDLGNDRAILSLAQSGTSFMRTLDAFQAGGPDEVSEYNVSPLKARITAATNDSTLPANIAVNQELATRSVAFTNWTLTLDQVNEPENQDVEIEGIHEIEMTIGHGAYTLQTLGLAALDIPPNHGPLTSGMPHTPTSTPEPLTGTYIGTVTFTDPAGLTPLDLVVVLTDSDGALTGYVDADQVPGYPVVGDGKGPAVTGSWSGESFALLSVVFADPHTGASRQLALVDGTIEGEGEILNGEYYETLWGLMPGPIVLSGEFQLSRPAHLPPAGQAAALHISAMPGRIEPEGTSSIVATMVDFYGDPVSQAKIDFSVSAGSVGPSATTDNAGEAVVTYTATETPGWVTVSASAGDLTDTVRIEVAEPPRVYLPVILSSR